MKNNRFLFFVLMLLVAAAGCSDDDHRPPQERILGKWQEVACWNDYFPELTPRFYTIEFLPDGTYHGPYGLYSSSDDGGQTQYRIASDSLCFKREGYSDYIYRYTFKDKSHMLVEAIYGMIPYTMDVRTSHIFERVK
ncbi:MAG: hypothetical protein LBI58_07490 [Tannerellaceae bacterium]|jgi:hypothetical protein|nr:hypothetical protein [Tannerellaceae bacterium]